MWGIEKTHGEPTWKIIPKTPPHTSPIWTFLLPISAFELPLIPIFKGLHLCWEVCSTHLLGPVLFNDSLNLTLHSYLKRFGFVQKWYLKEKISQRWIRLKILSLDKMTRQTLKSWINKISLRLNLLTNISVCQFMEFSIVSPNSENFQALLKHKYNFKWKPCKNIILSS